MHPDSKIVIDVSIPQGWHDLTQRQLRFAFSIIGRSHSKEYLMLHCFLRWSGLKVIGRDSVSGSYLLRLGKDIFSVSPIDMQQWMKPLEWIAAPPESPVILRRIGRHAAACDELFDGVGFGTYLNVSFLYNAYASHNDDSLISRMAEILYGFRPRRMRPWIRTGILFWMYSLHKSLAAHFPTLFTRRTDSSDGTGSLAGPSIEDSTDAMIRALTKGDVLKEKEILKIDTWRALTELEAIAKESLMIQQTLKK